MIDNIVIYLRVGQNTAWKILLRNFVVEKDMYLHIIEHLHLYWFSAFTWRKLIDDGVVNGHLYFTVQPTYFWRGKVTN